MKTKKEFKRFCVLLLSLTIFATVGFSGFTASAAAESQISFEDYSKTESEINNYYSDILGYYYNSSDSRFDYMTTVKPTDSYTSAFPWIRPVFGQIDQKPNGGTVYDRIGSMSPKDASGKLVSMKNSYIKLSDIRIGADFSGVFGAVWIGLRQATPGKFIDGLYKFNKDQIFVRITNTGITVASGAELEALSGSAENAAVEDYKFDDTAVSYLRKNGNKFIVEVKLIENNCSVTVKPCTANAFTAVEYKETVSEDAPSAGYLSFGMGDTGSYALYNSLVRNLDNNGNAIDFDSAKSPVVSSALPVYRTVAVGATVEDIKLPERVTALDANGDKYFAPVIWDTTALDTSAAGVITLNGTVTSSDVLKTAGFVNATAKITVSDTQNEQFTSKLKPYSDSLGDSFVTTWNHTSDYKTLKFTDLFCDAWGGYTGRSNSSSYPYRTDNLGEYYSRIAGITPIDANGKALELRNFELTFDYRVHTDTPEKCGAVWVGFRQKEAGHFFMRNESNQLVLNKEMSFVRVTNTGITVAGGVNYTDDAKKAVGAEDIAMPTSATEFLRKNGSLVTVKVRVVGNDCEVNVFKSESGELLMSYSETLSAALLQTGYLTLGIGDRQIHMINLNVKGLDESGNAVDLTEYTRGDANGDNRVDIRDLVRIKKYASGSIDKKDIYFKNAKLDASTDGIGATDISLLRKLLTEIA